jgi:choline dehydrogenase-like flavoprotein
MLEFSLPRRMDWRSVDYDAIVVGSGAAGGMAAKCLTDGGANVLLLEAGPLLPPEASLECERSAKEFNAIKQRQPIQSQNLLYNSRNCHLFIDDLDNPYSTATGHAFNWIRSRQAGGRTLTWSRLALRMSDEEFQGVPERENESSWPITYRDLAPYYDKVEALIGVSGTAEGLASLPDGRFLPRIVPGFLGDFRERLFERCPGLHIIPSREVRADRHSKEQLPSYSSLGSTLRQCDRDRLTLRSNCVVAHIKLDRADHATGVVFIDANTKTWHDVSGRVIVLCASTIESIRVLFASANRDFPKGVGNSAGLLGHYLMDHLGGPRLVALGRVKHAQPRSFERAYIPHSCNGEVRHENYVGGYGIQADFEVGDQGTAIVTIGVWGEVLPCFKNCVQPDDALRDSCGLKVPRVQFQYGENERKMTLHARAMVGKIIDALGFRVMTIRDETLPPGTRAHELGGAKMGTNSRNSILNRFNQCWDVPNVFVTDGACFPRAGYKGPTLTIMAITARACDYILQEMRRNAF